MSKDKSLIKAKNTLFYKIRNLIKRLSKKRKADNDVNYQMENAEEDNFKKTYSKHQEYNEKLLQLQNQYEAGIKTEEDMTLIEKEFLKILYKEQIKVLQTDVEKYEQELMACKEKISRIKDNL